MNIDSLWEVGLHNDIIIYHGIMIAASQIECGAQSLYGSSNYIRRHDRSQSSITCLINEKT